jgi:ribosome-associated protein
MNIQQLQALVIDALEDVKAQDIRLFDTMHLTSMFERLAIASGTSNRQTRALASSVIDKVKQAGGHVAGMEGEDTGEWVLVDLGDMVVHIMQAPIRAYYRLEELWGERPITLEQAKKAAKADSGAGDAKPKRARAGQRNNSATEALEIPKKTRSRSAAPADADADATTTATKPRSRKPATPRAGSAAEAPARAPRTRKSADASAPAAPRVRKSADAAAPAPRTRKSADATSATPAAPRARKTSAGSTAAAAPAKPRTRKPRSTE